MDAENFAKLTAILDLLDRYKKNLAQALQQEAPGRARSVLQAGRTLSKRSTRTEGLFGFGSGNEAHQQMDAVAHALERRKTIKRTQTLLLRRRTRVRRSFPSLSEPASKSVSISCLDEELQSCVASRGMLHMFGSNRSTDKQESDESDCDAQSDCLDYMSDRDVEPPDVDWEDSASQRRLSTCSLENMTTDDYTNLHPQVLGQLFDKILDYLQNDFDDLVGKLKEQNVHLKQDVISLRKKLQDAVETNDEQVQELKEMTERISDLEAEGRELTRQLSTLEARIKAYQENQKDLVKLEEEKHNLSRECAALQELIKKLTVQASTQDSQKVTELAHDLVTLKGTTQAKDEEIKSLKRELDRKGRLLESLNVTLSTQQQAPTLESPRGGDVTSRQVTPRGSISHLFGAAPNPRRASVKQLLVTPQPVPAEPAVSLATELHLTKLGSMPRRLSEVQDKLRSTLAELDTVRQSNEELKAELTAIKKEMEERDAVSQQKLEERSRELAAAREQLERKSAELQRTAQALEATKDDLNTSTAALCLTAADNEHLQAQVQEARQMLRDAQESHANALASRAPADVVKSLEEKVAEQLKELQVKASLLDQAEKHQAELEEQRATLQRSVEENMKQIEELSSRVKSLEGQLVETTNVANALGVTTHKLMELVKRGSVSEEERAEAEKRREELLELLEKERRRADALAQSALQQRSMEAEQREFEANAREMQEQLQQQVEFLKGRLAKQESEAETLKQELVAQANAAQEAKEEMQAELRSAYNKLQELKEQLQEATRQKFELEMKTAEFTTQKEAMSRLNEEKQEALRVQEREVQHMQVRMQELLDKIQDFATREAAFTEEAERLKKNIADLELGLQAEKEETQQLLSQKEEEKRQLELAQKAALAVMQEQIEQLEKEKCTALEQADQGALCLRKEYEELAETIKGLREQNSSLSAQLEQANKSHEQVALQWHQKHEALLDSLSKAQEKYRELEATLERSTEQYQRSLEDAQRQLVKLQAAELEGREAQFKDRLKELEQGCLRLHVEVSELKERHATAPQPVMQDWNLYEAAGLKAQRDVLAEQVEKLHEQLRAKDMESAHAIDKAEENQRHFQQLLASLQEQQRKLEEQASNQKEKALIAANERMRRENEYLKGELEELKALILTERRDAGLAGVLEVLQRQLHDLANEFNAFKKVEAQQLSDLKGAVSGTTQVFNVSYPPFVIPLVNVHESRDSNDKTINISGMLDIRAAATGIVPSGFGGVSRPPIPALQGSRFQDWLCKWRDGCWSANDSQNAHTCCSSAAYSTDMQSERWQTHTQVFKPAYRETLTYRRRRQVETATLHRLQLAEARCQQPSCTVYCTATC
ncbi:myosin heavy chain, putative [Eimeria necatrix]|uniref:Myosin heavy chain, putative n=1 Tax=Eimeria necatrix TaxID=51315 RepID=U6MUV1_9EIME|nr:myosin heavy chain, putative [Eimeria necatrix]CDJ66863.1 myosin heavy chain, putative [Eimeria necatrix]